MIEVDSLVKHYGKLVAVRGVSFTAAKGEILGLLGPNGAGKTTIMRILAGYITPTSGRARLAGCDIQANAIAARTKLGYLPEHAASYTEMRVIEYLGFRAALKGVDPALHSERVANALAACDITGVKTRIIGQLSKGYRQRVSLASTLVHEPSVLILDEPTVGLDPTQQRDIRTLVRELGQERTLLFSTHILSEAEAVCDRVVIIDKGTLVADGSTLQLAAQFRSQSLTVEIMGDEAAAAAALAAIPSIVLKERHLSGTAKFRLQTSNAADPELRAAVSRALVDAGCTVIELSVDGNNLDDIFSRVTGQQEAA